MTKEEIREDIKQIFEEASKTESTSNNGWSITAGTIDIGEINVVSINDQVKTFETVEPRKISEESLKNAKIQWNDGNGKLQ